MKTRTKRILITSIVIASIVVLLTIFGVIDYNKALNGKKPIFIYHTAKVFNVESNIESINYYGIGYMVSICDNETNNYTFQLGDKLKERCYTSLTCTEDEKRTLTLSDESTVAYIENDKHSYEFSFFDDKLHSITATYLVPISSIEDEETWPAKTMQYFNVPGVSISIQKTNDTTYEIIQTCNIPKMSNDDIQNVCLLEYFDKNKVEIAKLTKTQIINQYSKDACK